MAAATTSYASSHPFSTSTSSRASVSDPPNPLTQLPNVDFNFEDLRQRMAAFTVKFDAFIERGRKRVLVERNEFRERLGELAGMFYLTTIRFLLLAPNPFFVFSCLFLVKHMEGNIC